VGEAVRGVEVTRVRGEARAAGVDHAATEEPLEIRLHGRPFAVIMRTPGADRELAAGFLLAEGVIKSAEDLGVIEYCTDPRADHPENIVNVTLVGGDADRALAERRQIVTGSSCGMCGRLTIESLRADGPKLAAGASVTPSVLKALPDTLRRAQAAFDETGGLHAAGLFTAQGCLDAIAEDVGRHNAVDKVLGRAVLNGWTPLDRHVLLVSGRSSFEIMQKALAGGVPVLAAVSAPSSLAVDFAHRNGQTLVGFLRDNRMNVYTHAHRVS
jgi:FdhD protein